MGEVFAGRYELVDPIGHGGVGAVWRAWDHRRHRYVAAKVLQQRDAYSLLRFVREQALRIDHPHVLAPASWAADDDKVLFTMDLVGGGSLAHVIGDYGPLPPRFVCTLLDQLLSGLAAVHAEGVVHRDIKPANILLEATGAGRPHLRVSDFGISMRKGEPRLTETDYVVGTPGYFAPEQMLGAEPDFTADLFAVGLVALYLLEGAKPDAKALIEYFAEHGTPRAPQGIAEPLWQVIATLLQPDPQTRFRTATGARKALASAAEMLPEAGPDDELIEIFDQLAPLPTGFGPDGPLAGAPRRPGHTPRHAAGRPPRHAAEPAPTPPAPPTSTPFPPMPRTAATPPTPNPAPLPAPPIPTATPTPPPASTPSPPPARNHADDWRTQGHPPSPDPMPASEYAQAPDPAPSGTFHLPPPVHPAQPPLPSTPPTPMPLRAPAPHLRPDPTPQPAHVPSPHQAVTSSAPRAHASTYPYTAHAAQVPPLSHPIPRPLTTGSTASPRRPGPPAKVAVPMLLAALTCLAVGVWALTQL
ncbi:protein kinase [Streptomyces sp. NPDC002564]|uniref:serine/threonine-protein kinase n=1 Tax=Streptomyces sp. NPDC002564 TaxID=3364649 RepID=UPI00369A482F